MKEMWGEGFREDYVNKVALTDMFPFAHRLNWKNKHIWINSRSEEWMKTHKLK